MAIETFDDLFMHLASDAYQAEKQHAKALPRLARRASNRDLRRALESHLRETKQQVQRLEAIFRVMKQDRPKSEICEAAEGLIGEAEQMMDQVGDEQVRDAAIIADAQAMEHYEIARYGTLVAWARRKGHREALRLLQQTLKEEHNANQLLNRLAEQSVNDGAIDNGAPTPSDRSGGGSQTQSRNPSSSRRTRSRQQRPTQQKGGKPHRRTSASRHRSARGGARKSTKQPTQRRARKPASGRRTGR